MIRGLKHAIVAVSAKQPYIKCVGVIIHIKTPEFMLWPKQ